MHHIAPDAPLKTFNFSNKQQSIQQYSHHFQRLKFGARAATRREPEAQDLTSSCPRNRLLLFLRSTGKKLQNLVKEWFKFFVVLLPG